MAKKKLSRQQARKLKKQTVKKPVVKKDGFWSKKENLIGIAICLVITAISFYPSLLNDFVYWDDDRNFLENEFVQVLNWDNVKNIFSTHVIGNYNPLTTLSFALEKHFFGFEQPFYWHLNNLILHLVCVFFVLRIGLLMGLNLPFAVILALLFGIHPMRVESVAWVTERKDVLFGAFYLSAMYYYIKYLTLNSKNKYLAIIIVLFVLSLLSKIQAVILPISFILLHYFFNKKFERKSMAFIGFMLILSLVFGLIGISFLGEQGSLESNNTYNFVTRLFIGAYSFVIYLVKFIAPYKMSPLYPYPAEIPWYLYLGMAPALLSILGLWIAFKKDKRHLVFGFAFFIVNIALLLQILGAGQGFLADRFTYIPYLGLFFILCYYGQKWSLTSPKLKNNIYSISGVVIIIFSVMTWIQCGVWKNSGTLWTHVLKYYSNTTLPYGNRANYYRDIGQIQKALADYSQTIKLKPKDSKPYNSRARLYFQNKTNSRDTLLLALQDYNKAIELKSDEPEYYVNRGAVYARLGRLNEAINDINQGLNLDPQNANAFLNRSVLYNQSGNVQLALADITSYLAIRPYDATMWYQKGVAQLKLNQAQQAIGSFNNAINIKPNVGEYYLDRSKAYYNTGNQSAATNDLRRAQQLGAQVDQAYLRLFQ